MSELFDTAFGDAVRLAAKGNGRALRDWLLSDKPIGRGERELMADFLCRDPEDRGGRPPGSKLKFAERRDAVLKYREQRAQKIQDKTAAPEVASGYKIQASTLRAWDKEFRDIVRRMNETHRRLNDKGEPEDWRLEDL